MCVFSCVQVCVGSHACMWRVKDNLCLASPYIDQAGPQSTEITDCQYKECNTSLSFYFVIWGGVGQAFPPCYTYKHAMPVPVLLSRWPGNWTQALILAKWVLTQLSCFPSIYLIFPTTFWNLHYVAQAGFELTMIFPIPSPKNSQELLDYVTMPSWWRFSWLYRTTVEVTGSKSMPRRHDTGKVCHGQSRIPLRPSLLLLYVVIQSQAKFFAPL